MQKLFKSVTKANSKVRMLKTYNEAVINLIHRNRWQEATDKDLWNLDSHQTWCYITLFLDYKSISCKSIFKIKYHLDKFIER